MPGCRIWSSSNTTLRGNEGKGEALKTRQARGAAFLVSKGEPCKRPHVEWQMPGQDPPPPVPGSAEHGYRKASQQRDFGAGSGKGQRSLQGSF